MAKVRAVAGITRRNELVLKHLDLVPRILNRIVRRLPRHHSCDTESLASAGNVGLIDAAAKFDPKKSEDFSAYAVYKIKGAILDEMRGQDVLSRDMRRRSTQILRQQIKLTGELNRLPTDNELAGSMGITVAALEKKRFESMNVTSVPPEYSDWTGKASDGILELDDYVHKQQRLKIVRKHIDRMPKRTQKILYDHCFHGKTLLQIAREMEITDSRVCQIYREALKKLKWLIR